MELVRAAKSVESREWGLLFAGVLTVVAIIGKQVCALGIMDKTMNKMSVGIGMIPRGEVALIVANMALVKGVISTDILSATILLVIISALITPLILKFGFTKLKKSSF